MNDNCKTNQTHEETAFSEQIARQAALKLKARRKGYRSIWFGLGISGMIGWSVTVPTLIGIAIGVWLDIHYRSQYSWALMLLCVGLFIGCLNAWRWVEAEDRSMHEDANE